MTSARYSSGRKVAHPATVAPAGSDRSGQRWSRQGSKVLSPFQCCRGGCYQLQRSVTRENGKCIGTPKPSILSCGFRILPVALPSSHSLRVTVLSILRRNAILAASITLSKPARLLANKVSCRRGRTLSEKPPDGARAPYAIPLNRHAMGALSSWRGHVRGFGP